MDGCLSESVKRKLQDIDVFTRRESEHVAGLRQETEIANQSYILIESRQRVFLHVHKCLIGKDFEASSTRASAQGQVQRHPLVVKAVEAFEERLKTLREDFIKCIARLDDCNRLTCDAKGNLEELSQKLRDYFISESRSFADEGRTVKEEAYLKSLMRVTYLLELIEKDPDFVKKMTDHVKDMKEMVARESRAAGVAKECSPAAPSTQDTPSAKRPKKL
jgi:hypothetical protein